MMAAFVLAGLCAVSPLFDTTGPDCVVTTEECRCSECLTWDPVDRSTYYEVRRTTVTNSTEYRVGLVLPKLLDEDGDTVLPTLWCAPWDVPFPHEGVQYSYKVRACNDADCGGWSNEVRYTGAPYACYSPVGYEEQCYVGDSVASR